MSKQSAFLERIKKDRKKRKQAIAYRKQLLQGKITVEEIKQKRKQQRHQLRVNWIQSLRRKNEKVYVATYNEKLPSNIFELLKTEANATSLHLDPESNRIRVHCKSTTSEDLLTIALFKAGVKVIETSEFKF